VVLRAGLNTEARGRILCLCRGSNTGLPLCSQTLLTELRQLANQIFTVENFDIGLPRPPTPNADRNACESTSWLTYFC
jgi:hypothetical protein